MDKYRMNQSKPVINIYSAANRDLPSYDRVISNLLAGIEEEEIPFHLVAYAPQEAAALAAQASRNSALGVGIGIERNLKMSLHYIKMSPSVPLFSLPGVDSGLEEIRAFGGNAAKLVKGYPFKIR